MLSVGKTDVFEREYTEKFRMLARQFGEFVMYERDRGARDVGLHLTHKLDSGSERLSASLCWFQLKGLMSATLSAKEFRAAKEIKLSLRAQHLKYWYLQPMPTYLVVYIESADKFLIMNIQRYVEQSFGPSILKVTQDQITVSVPTSSALDEQAFNLLLREGDVQEWTKALSADEQHVRMCRRDLSLVWHLGTAANRGVTHRLVFWDWQSKTRSQLFFEETAVADPPNWQCIREHWQPMMSIEDLFEAYPYLNFTAFSGPTTLASGATPPLAADDSVADREPDGDWEADGYIDDESDDSGVPALVLPNGSIAYGTDNAGEYISYELRPHLNELGRRLFESVLNLIDIGLVRVTPGAREWISIAPWEGRSV